MPSLLGIQSKATKGLLEYLDEERRAESRNLNLYEQELEMADHLFLAAQQVFVAYSWRNTKPHRALAALMCSCTKYFASSVGLCLNGNPAEAMTIMRSSMEAAAYATKIREHPKLVDLWVDSEDQPKAFRKAFGKDSELFKQPLMVEAGQTYGAYSAFGTHARFVRTADAIILEEAGAGWRLAHARTDDHYCRFQLLGILLTMRDIVAGPLMVGFLEKPYPESIEAHLAGFETIRARIGRDLPLLMKWITSGQQKIDWKRRSPRLVLASMKIDRKAVENLV